jgi:NitT/TauT family transport system substrate-binding protein
MRKRSLPLVLACVIASLTAATPLDVAGAAGDRAPALTNVVLATGFQPDVEFAPYYVAQDLGYYKAQGLDVTINYDRVPDLLQEVANGKYTFAVQSGDAMLIARSTGIPVTYVMAQYQKYPIGAMTLKNGGPVLNTPVDLKGQTVGFSAPGSATYIGLRALLKAGHLSESDIHETAIGFTETQSLVAKQIDVAMTYIDNEPVQVRALGYPVNVMAVSKYIKLVSNGVVTSTALTKKNPALVQKFVTATLEGLQYTLKHPNKAFTSSMKRQPEVTDPAQLKIQRKVLTARLTFQQPPKGHPLGWSNPKHWKTTFSFLRSIGSIRPAVSLTSVDINTFTNAFADRARI